MESSSLLNEGISLMLFGMGFVFVFLTLLVFATLLMSKLVTIYERNVGVLPEGGVPSPTAVIPHADHTETTGKQSDPTLMAVLSAAVNQYRSRHK